MFFKQNWGLFLQAKLEQQGDVVIIHLSGQMDYETVDSFKQQCLSQLNGENVLFSLENLNFVGSSGLTPFVEAMTEFSEASEQGLRLCGVGLEFKKLFESNQPSNQKLKIFDNIEIARSSFL